MRRVMKTKCMFAVFLIFLFLFQSCSQKQEIKPIDISLEKDLEIGIEEGDENYMFAGVIDVEVDSKGNIFVLDWKNRTVKKFDNKGKFICDIGKKGQGPGEYSAILVDSCLDRSDRFYVVELMKVHIFDEYGKFVHSFVPDLFPRDIMIDQEDKIILVGLKKEKIFHVYSQEGKYLDSFGEPFSIPEKLRRFYPSGKTTEPWDVHLSEDGKIFAVNPFKYEIDVYQDKNLVEKISRSSPFYRFPKIIKNEKGKEDCLYTYIKILESNNHIFVWYGTEIKKYTLAQTRYLDIYGKKDHIFFGTIPIEEQGRPSTIRQNWMFFNIYSDESDFPKVTRYKIVYNESKKQENNDF